MPGLSKKTRYALEAVVDIAYNAGSGPVQARDITARQGIPQRYLEQVMQKLVRAGILKGVRGPRGGYYLAMERRRISVGDVVRVVGDLEPADGDVAQSETSPLAALVVGPAMAEVRSGLLARLDTITIQDLCDRARAEGVPRADRQRLDFAI